MPTSPQARQALMVALVVIFLTGLLPSRWLFFWKPFASGLEIIRAPISQPLNRLGGALRRRPDPTLESEAVQRAHEEAQRAELRVLQLQAELERLQGVVHELGIVQTIDTRLDVRTIVAAVYAAGSDLAPGPMRVNAGAADGLRKGSVAITRGLQIVGRVDSVDSRTASVLPIIAPETPRLDAVIVFDAQGGGVAETLSCSLKPIPGGRLQGPFAEKKLPGTTEQVLPKPGQIVRLADDKWPISAQRLVIGRVESVEPSQAFPQRKVVTVVPTVPQLHLLGEIFLRVEPEVQPPAKAGGAR